MNKYNPNIHHRRSIRLKGFDYSQTGLYFITLCVQDRICLFGKIADDEILLNDFGIIVWENWEKLPERFPNVKLDVFQIMPNHIHGIIHVGATLAVAQNARNDAVAHNDAIGAGAIRAGASPAPTRTGSKTVGDIVGAYKSLVANDCLKIFKQKNVDERMGKLWQRKYYEHIIGDEQSYQRISEYIINNPKNWKEDQLYNQI